MKLVVDFASKIVHAEGCRFQRGTAVELGKLVEDFAEAERLGFRMCLADRARILAERANGPQEAWED